MIYELWDEDALRRKWARSIREEDRAEKATRFENSRPGNIAIYLEPRLYNGTGLLPIFTAIELICDGYGVRPEAFFISDGGTQVRQARACLSWGLSKAGWSDVNIAKHLMCVPQAAIELANEFDLKATERAKQLGGEVIEAARQGSNSIQPIEKTNITSYKLIAKFVVDEISRNHTMHGFARLSKIADLAVGGVLYERGLSVKMIAAFLSKPMGVVYEEMLALGKGSDPVADEIIERVITRVDELRSKHKIA